MCLRYIQRSRAPHASGTAIQPASREIPRQASSQAVECETDSDAALQRLDAERFDDGLRWLCLDTYLLAERHPQASLACWLHACLDPAQAWEYEFTVLLNLLCRDRCQVSPM